MGHDELHQTLLRSVELSRCNLASRKPTKCKSLTIKQESLKLSLNWKMNRIIPDVAIVLHINYR